MFFNSSSFKVMEAGVNLAWLQQEINTQNVANIETPGYKAQSLSFESVLDNAKNAQGNSEISCVNARVETSEADSLRPDGNNVDAEGEYLSMYKAYAQYSLLLDKINAEFDKYNMVLGANM